MLGYRVGCRGGFAAEFFYGLKAKKCVKGSVIFYRCPAKPHEIKVYAYTL